MKSKRILSLVCCVLMMIAAALCVNKEVFGYDAEPAGEQTATPSDTVSVLPDGTIVVHTRPLTNFGGYAGPVPLDISISNTGVITDITALPNGESPGFFKRAEKLLSSWKGLSAAEAETLKVDAVTGATYSSEAIKANVQAGVRYYLKDADKSKKPFEMPLKMWIAFAVTLIACIVPLLVKNKIYMTVQLIANVVVLGFWCGQFLDYYLMLKYLSTGISLPVGLTAILMLVSAFVYPVFGRPQYYCSHVCPFGSAQILLGKITKHKIKLSAKAVKGLDWFRKILWAALMLLLWCDVLTRWMDYELFQVFLIQSAPTAVIVAAALFLILSVFIPRPYCRFVCPTGSLIKRAENIG